MRNHIFGTQISYVVCFLFIDIHMDNEILLNYLRNEWINCVCVCEKTRFKWTSIS